MEITLPGLVSSLPPCAERKNYNLKHISRATIPNMSWFTAWIRANSSTLLSCTVINALTSTAWWRRISVTNDIDSIAQYASHFQPETKRRRINFGSFITDNNIQSLMTFRFPNFKKSGILFNLPNFKYCCPIMINQATNWQQPITYQSCPSTFGKFSNHLGINDVHYIFTSRSILNALHYTCSENDSRSRRRRKRMKCLIAIHLWEHSTQILVQMVTTASLY